MYSVDDLDTVVDLGKIPQQSTGAPLPVLVANDSTVLLAYIISEPGQDWDGVPTVVSSAMQNAPIAVIEFRFPLAHMFGPPNDEGLAGHPLANRGLAHYSGFEVQQSSWIRHLERMNSVHPGHDKERFLANLRHFIFTFHDRTFECVARGLEVRIERGSIGAELTKMAEILGKRT